MLLLYIRFFIPNNIHIIPIDFIFGFNDIDFIFISNINTGIMTSVMPYISDNIAIGLYQLIMMNI